MAYLRGLSRGRRITLITYEKDKDWSDSKRMAHARAECQSLGIRWLPQRFRASPKLVAPALSMARMIWLVLREVRGQEVRLIHARSYIPAAVALLVGWLTGVPFIFDMRALWPEELIAAGRLRRGSLLHRAIVAAERAYLRRAAAVVSLTHAAADYLKRTYPRETAGQTIIVIPTCVDLVRFTPAQRTSPRRTIGCLGTLLSGWFRLDWLVAFLDTVASEDAEIAFELTTRDDRELVTAAFRNHLQLTPRLRIGPNEPEEIPNVLHEQIASVMFFTDGLSKLGSCPTRMGEILGCGLPIVANDGVGDLGRIIRENRVGILVAGPGRKEMEAAWEQLRHLLTDPGLGARCRKTAEELFSLDSGTAAYERVYADILRI